MKMIIGGLFGGVIGAAIWAGIVYATQYEIGWIAIGVGFLVGAGVRAGASEDSDGTVPGLLSVGISVGSIVLAKYMVIYFLFGGGMDLNMITYTDEDMIEQYVTEIIEQKEEAGEEITLPEEVYDIPMSEYYPKEIWEAASAQWNELSEDEKSAEIKQTEEEVRKSIEEISSSMKYEVFKASFGGMDILFFLIAAYTAFNVGSGRSEEE